MKTSNPWIYYLAAMAAVVAISFFFAWRDNEAPLPPPPTVEAQVNLEEAELIARLPGGGNTSLIWRLETKKGISTIIICIIVGKDLKGEPARADAISCVR